MNDGQPDRRPRNACLPCKALKARCELGRAQGGPCQRCEARGIACKWPPGPDRRRTRTDTKARVEQLELLVGERDARIAQLEARLAALGSSQPDSLPSVASGPVPSSASPRSPDDLPAVQSRTLDVLEADADGELRAYNETNTFRGQPVEPPANPSAANYGFLPVPLSTALHAEILDLAFRWQLGAWQSIDRGSFLENMYIGGRTRYYSPFLHLSILAIGCRYLQDPPPFLCSDPSDPSTRGEPFAKAALDLLGDEIASPKFSTIRGLMVISHFVGGNSRPHAGWVLFGIACRMSCDFGLMVDPPADSPIDTRLREYRRRLFWDVFVHDTAWSFFLGRTPYFKMLTIGQPYPATAPRPSTPFLPPSSSATAQAQTTPPNLTLWDLETSLSVLGHKILQLNYCHPTHNPGSGNDASVRALLSELEEWYESHISLAERKDEVVIRSPASTQLHFDYYLLMILLLRPYLARSAAPETATLAVDRIDKAAEKVANLAKLSDDAAKEGTEDVQYFSDHLYQVLFHAGAVSLELAARLPPRRASTSTASPAPPVASAAVNTQATLDRLLSQTEQCIASLARHAALWTSAARCATVLIELRGAALIELAGRVAQGEPPTGSSAQLPPSPNDLPSTSSSSTVTTTQEPPFPQPYFTLYSHPHPQPHYHPYPLPPALPSLSSNPFDQPVPHPGSFFPLAFGGLVGDAIDGGGVVRDSTFQRRLGETEEAWLVDAQSSTYSSRTIRAPSRGETHCKEKKAYVLANTAEDGLRENRSGFSSHSRKPALSLQRGAQPSVQTRRRHFVAS